MRVLTELLEGTDRQLAAVRSVIAVGTVLSRSATGNFSGISVLLKYHK